MQRIFSILFLFISIASNLFSQTYSGTGGNIPDYPGTATFTINVSGLTPSTIDTANFGLESVCINANHTWDSDLEISLIAPDGSTVVLSSGNGGSGDNYTNTCFDGVSPNSIVSGNAPFTGNFKSQEEIGFVNNGQNGNGNWKLFFRDMYSQDSGSCFSWSITFGNNPAQVTHLDSSNLPIVVINTYSQTIIDQPKIFCHMGITNNGYNIQNHMGDPYNEYNGRIGVEIRGSSSQMFPQKAYGVTLVDSSNLQIDSNLFGMSKEHDWILYAPYDDKTCIRNILTYKLAREMSGWAPRTKLCELVVNGQYEGIYVFMEKIKRDKKRVDISKLDSATANTWPAISGGYIIKIDKFTGNGGGGWTSPYPPIVNTGGQTIYYMYDYPKDIKISTPQKNYIQAYVDSFETAAAGPNFQDISVGWRRFGYEPAFIDYFIMDEISKNVDGYRLSSYLTKDSVHGKLCDGKLMAGPLWDFNLAWWNADYCDGFNAAGWAYQFGNICGGDSWQVPFWWDRFMQDSIYVRDLKCRWTDLRSNILDTTHIFHLIDSMATYLSAAQQRHFVKWPILGVYTWPNPSPLATTYQGEVDNLKAWIRNRTAWIDANIPGNCWNVGIDDPDAFKNSFLVYPNPFGDELQMEFFLAENSKLKIELCDALGRTIVSQNEKEYEAGKNHLNLDLAGKEIPAGIYFLKVTSPQGVFAKKITRMK